MLVNLLKAKIHRACVTDSKLDYEGSIFVHKGLLERAGILFHERVDIYNINTGARFSTYAVPVEQHGVVCVNGAAARLVQKNDLIIICAYAFFSQEEALNHDPIVILINNK